MSPLLWLLGIALLEVFVVWLFLGRSSVSRASQATDRIKAHVRANVGSLSPDDRMIVLEQVAEWCDEWVIQEATAIEEQGAKGPGEE